MMIIDNKFNIGDIVYLKTDVNQLERMVTSLQVTPNTVTYRLSCGEFEGWYYDLEIETEKNILAE